MTYIGYKCQRASLHVFKDIGFNVPHHIWTHIIFNTIGCGTNSILVSALYLINIPTHAQEALSKIKQARIFTTFLHFDVYLTQNVGCDP